MWYSLYSVPTQVGGDEGAEVVCEVQCVHGNIISDAMISEAASLIFLHGR